MKTAFRLRQSSSGTWRRPSDRRRRTSCSQSPTDSSRQTRVQDVLRRALARAGIVLGYELRCRQKACGYREACPRAEEKRCPRDGMKLWPKAKVRPIRIHDLRHTTASLLLIRGESNAVQRILRHSDPRITTEVYGHLLPDYLRAEIDRLSFTKDRSQATTGQSSHAEARVFGAAADGRPRRG